MRDVTLLQPWKCPPGYESWAIAEEVHSRLAEIGHQLPIARSWLGGWKARARVLNEVALRVQSIRFAWHVAGWDGLLRRV